MKKYFCCVLTVILLLCCVSAAGAASFNYSIITDRGTFFYNDDTNTDWTYWGAAEKMLGDGTYVEVLVAAWGNADALTFYPELRIFSSSEENSAVIMQDATVIIDGNMYELTMKELVLDSSHGAYFYLTSDAEAFVKSLAASKSFSIILRHSGGTVGLSMSSDEMRTVSQFAYDLLAMDYLNHIEDSEAVNEALRKEETPITSYVFNEILLDEQHDAQANAENPTVTADEWKGYYLQKMGVKIYLPASFIVYTHGMSPDDPAVISRGITPDEIDETLDMFGCAIQGSPDGFSTEVRAAKGDSTFSDFSSMSEEQLLELSSVWPTAYKMMGIDICELDIFTSGDMKYFRIRQKYADSDRNDIHAVQYYTVLNKQSYSFVYSKISGELTEDELRFFQTVVERVEF